MPRPRRSITIDGKPICDAELRFRLMPFPADMRALMEAASTPSA